MDNHFLHLGLSWDDHRALNDLVESQALDNEALQSAIGEDKKTALLILNTAQKGSKIHTTKISESVFSLRDAFHKADQRVFIAYDLQKEKTPKIGIFEIEESDLDIVFRKPTSSAFYQTKLKNFLSKPAVKNLIIVGADLSYDVQASALNAISTLKGNIYVVTNAVENRCFTKAKNPVGDVFSMQKKGVKLVSSEQIIKALEFHLP